MLDKRKFKFILPVLVLSGLPMLSYASVCDSEKTVQQLLQQTGKYSEDGYYDCRALPHQTGYSMLAIAELKPESEENDMGEYFIHLFKVNDQTKQITARYRDPDSYVSDAIRLNGIKLDTAAYQLNAKQRAIGVRINYQGPSRVYPYYANALSLYDFEKRQRVLSSLNTEINRGENDTNCKGEWEEHKAVLHMLNSQTKGMADIKVTANIKSFETKMIKGECSDFNERADKVNFVMKFDGQQYQIPKPFKETYHY